MVISKLGFAVILFSFWLLGLGGGFSVGVRYCMHRDELAAEARRNADAAQFASDMEKARAEIDALTRQIAARLAQRSF